VLPAEGGDPGGLRCQLGRALSLEDISDQVAPDGTESGLLLAGDERTAVAVGGLHQDLRVVRGREQGQDAAVRGAYTLGSAGGLAKNTQQLLVQGRVGFVLDLLVGGEHRGGGLRRHQALSSLVTVESWRTDRTPVSG
jgi:hypothetical protein